MSLQEIQHVAILKSQKSVIDLTSFLVQQGYMEPTTGYKRTLLTYSLATLKHLIEDEVKRDVSIFEVKNGQSLRSMSSGERKRALLQYLLSLDSKFLIVENVFDNLDVENRKLIEALLMEAAKKISIIQVVARQDELLPFIKDFFVVENAKDIVPYKKAIESFFEEKTKIFDDFSIPKTTTKYAYAYNTFVKLQDVSVSFYEKKVLGNISWEIKLGEFWQLIGANGTGKTTLLSLITGDSHKAYGQNIVLFDKLKGTEENVWEIKQKIGYFTPNITELFNRRHSVLHMVLSGFYDSIGLYIKPLDIHVKLAKEWLELMQLTDLANKTFCTLTMSQQRMVLIARAMVKHPPLLILDEPTSGLDKDSIAIIVALINKIAKETRTTIIYVSHIMEKGLEPDHTYKLEEATEGSIGAKL
ncbi:ATP-binding cassette domain-containing protein [Flavicella sediminum]|uniref:ATP-binding cassette domain-containing protein n=1 Tax=Flavicella sediminum TaxID=2585141 RepID=UPI0011242403|nr:ATP-binding cassette domain-containing protein [Flavicella sediminum]